MLIGMYRIAIFKIRPEPDSTGYQTNYPAGTGYLDTCCIIVNFLVYFVVRIKMCYSQCLFSALCAHTLHRSTTNICKRVGLHDSLDLWSLITIWPSTIRLRYPVPGTVLAGTGAGTGFEKMAGCPANRNRISSTSLNAYGIVSDNSRPWTTCRCQHVSTDKIWRSAITTWREKQCTQLAGGYN